jgi:hypothetical protein
MTPTVDAFVEAFGQLGYEVIDDPGVHRAGYERIALYTKDGKVTHAARQLASGRWTSKLGDREDISHALPSLNGDQYGAPETYLERARPTVRRKAKRKAKKRRAR